MTNTMNYDPNLVCSGRMAKQAVRLTFGMWQYRKTMEVEVGGNCTGLTVIDAAVARAFDQLDNEQIILENQNGDTLICEDDEDHGEDWLKDMLLSAEIVSIEPKD